MQNLRLESFPSVKAFFENKIRDDHLSAEFENIPAEKLGSDEDKNIFEWLHWSKSRQGVVSVEAAVPSSVVDGGGVIVDMKVDGRKREPEDKIYDENVDIRRRVARGNCALELHRPGRPHFVCLIHAMKKFTGGMGDENEDNGCGDDMKWKRYFLKPIEETKELVITQKANGEVAHLGVRWLDGQFLICVGSKNVHMVVRRRSDIDLYKEPRYQVARQVAFAVMDHLETLDSLQCAMLFSFLHHTRFTAVFELLQPNHQSVEDLSHLTSPELWFLAWTPTYNPSDEQAASSLYGCSPQLGFQLAEAYGLKTVQYDTITGDVLQKLPEVMLQVRKGHGYEGKVIVFLDANRKVIGLLKKKTVWYILLRALREKLCYVANKSSYSELSEQISKRFRALQCWLGFDDAYLKAWIDLGLAFAKWCKQTDLTPAEIRTKLPLLWKEFLQKTNRMDEFDLDGLSV